MIFPIKEVVLASHNKGKIIEIKQILTPIGILVRDIKDVLGSIPIIEETGSTFEQNAEIKAQWLFSRTGLCTLADDSGLEVDVLGGEPGVYSARYAGQNATDEMNNAKLLEKLNGLDWNKRMARFRCVIVLIYDHGKTICVEGCCEGHINFEPRGKNGFGYDPLFIPLGYEKTFAELDTKIKNSISHRAKALQKLVESLKELGE